MNKTEVFNEITSKHKFYVGYCSAAYATELKQKFSDGRLGEKALQRLFEHFGYVLREESQWIKTKVEQPKIKRK